MRVYEMGKKDRRTKRQGPLSCKHIKLYFPDLKDTRTFPIESSEHDSGRTLVRAEYGYPKGSPNTNN
jgi:hypothetical protein